MHEVIQSTYHLAIQKIFNRPIKGSWMILFGDYLQLLLIVINFGKVNIFKIDTFTVAIPDFDRTNFFSPAQYRMVWRVNYKIDDFYFFSLFSTLLLTNDKWCCLSLSSFWECCPTFIFSYLHSVFRLVWLFFLSRRAPSSFLRIFHKWCH